jgi:hypothetical protein
MAIITQQMCFLLLSNKFLGVFISGWTASFINVLICGHFSINVAFILYTVSMALQRGHATSILRRAVIEREGFFSLGV